MASRIDYLTNPSAAAKTLQRRIASIRNGKGFVDYRGSSALAAEIDAIAHDIEADILPGDPSSALTLAEKLIALDAKIFERADDSGGSIGFSLRNSCVLWLTAAASVRAATGEGATAVDWAGKVYDLYQSNDYGIREPLLKEASRLLSEQELRALAACFEQDTLVAVELARNDETKFHHVFAPSSAMGLVAEALRDPVLHERSIRIYSPEPNNLQAANIAEQYMECGDSAGALRWLQGKWRSDIEHRRLELLDRAYALQGDIAGQAEIRRQAYSRAPSVHTYRALEEVLPEHERAELRTQALQNARVNPSVASGAELLFVLGEAQLAEDLIVSRAEELDGRYYGTLLDLAGTATTSGRLLAATLLWRVLLDAILARAYAKAYHHAADYLHELRRIAPLITDYRGQMTHAQYERSMSARHARKVRFWTLVEERGGRTGGPAT
jgi:hypothetical protein